MPLLTLLNQPIVLVDLCMINITPNFVDFRFVFSAYLTLFLGDSVFLAITPVVPCENTSFCL